METTRTSGLKARLLKNQPSVGSWITLAHPAIPEIMADAGFEWLVVDMEHSVITIREAEELIRIIDLKGLTALVRTTGNDPAQIKRLMDAGAHGVIVPMVNSRQQAEAAVRAVKYPPLGTRGVGLARAQKYGPGFDAYRISQADSLVIAQIEHVDAVRNLEQILAVEGIDATMVGPYDLSASMGKPGRFNDPDVCKVLAEYETLSRRLHKPMGFHVVPPDHSLMQEKAAKGYSFLAFSTDFLFLGENCRSQMQSLKARLGKTPKMSRGRNGAVR